MNYSRLKLPIRLILTICFLSLLPSRAFAASASMTWSGYPATAQLGEVITLSATITNNTGAALTGQLCTLGSSFDKDTSHALGAALTYDTGASTSNSSSFSYSGATLQQNPGFNGGTSYNIGFTFSPGYSVPDGQSATLVAKAKVRTDNTGSAGDVISASLYCQNTASNLAADIPQSTTIKLTVAGTPATTSTTPTTLAPKTTTTNSSTTPLTSQNQPIATPTLTDIKVANTSVKMDQAIELKPDQELGLSGSTVPKGVVTIYLFSDPQKFTTTADDKGNWSYTLKNMPLGSHHLEAETTDPATGKTSERKQLFSFVVQPAAMSTPLASAQNPKSNRDSRWLWLIASVALILGLGTYVGWRLWRLKQQTKLKSQVPESTEESTVTSPSKQNEN